MYTRFVKKTKELPTVVPPTTPRIGPGCAMRERFTSQIRGVDLFNAIFPRNATPYTL